MRRNLLKPVASIAVPLIIGFLGSMFTRQSVGNWFVTLKKPVFAPPNWLFAPAWALLYIMMGIAFYLIWQQGYSVKLRWALVVYGLQLILNLLWSLFFFGLRSPLLGLVDIVLLWILVIINTILFYHLRHAAGLLLIPYILWLTFALLLNLSIVILN
ncbi:MAG: tryptophan-rich sensory protein [candidate division WOR-3 bacterium]|uniref:Tryptophan-rich sensory protein n=1 Tax=candidate division WOR-3 bacterium TaxID=2052148 RepID=A0A7C1NGK8_UNCW3|nr:tryptophan-rich sensory protein [candidate division WOR-3 bacterium]